jgi:divalent metal cation (Fe/Co/Zn/Cd) transporter
MDGNITLEKAHTIASSIEERLKEEFGPETHIGIHMEPTKPQCAS